MKRLLPIALLLCAASCRTAELPLRPSSHGEGTPLRTEGTPPGLKLDSTRTKTPPTLAQKVGAKLGIKPRPSTAIGKKSTVNYYYGPATVSTVGKKATAAIGDNATASQVGKKAGPTVVGDSSTATALTGGGVVSQITGDGNAPTLTNAPVEAPGIGATIAAKLTGPLGWVLGVAAAGGIVYGIVQYRNAKKIIS